MNDTNWELELAALAKGDEWYQELLGKLTGLEPEYIRIRDALPREDRDRLEAYISLCEEMQYRMTVLAYKMGRKV